MFFFQKQDMVYQTLLTEADGVVAVICHHGIRREHRYGTVAADLSFCFLTPAILDLVVPWWQSSSSGHESGIRVQHDEYALIQQFVQLLAVRSKDAVDWKVPPSRAPVPAHLQKYFTRVLFPPLFTPDRCISVRAREVALEKGTGGKLGLEQEMRTLKDEGALLVRQRHHAEAISRYQSAIVKYIQAQAESPAVAQLAVQCYLNIALCVLEPRNPAVAKEAEACCDRRLRSYRILLAETRLCLPLRLTTARDKHWNLAAT